MIKKIIFSSVLICFIFGFFNQIQAQSKHELDTTWNEWKFRISPYFWYIGFEGTIYRPPQPTNYPIPPPPKFDIDVGFKDIRNNIKFALMLSGTYRSEHIITNFNISSLVLESEAITPLELLLQDNIVKLAYFGGDVTVGYRAINKPKFELDALLALKFIYFGIGLKTNIVGVVPVEGERSRFWVDPAIGINLIYRPHRKVEFNGLADIGPAFPDNIFNYQLMLGANYYFTKTFLVTLGYRTYALEFSRDEAIFNGDIKGWIMRLGFQF